MHEPYYTNEELKKPTWTGLDHFQIYTSINPYVLGLHIAPYGSDEQYTNVDNLLNDISVFNIDWTRQHLHRFNNGFQAGRYKITYHSHGWEPSMGYDAMVIKPYK